MNAAALEAFLARLYTDAALLAEFMRNPESIARGAGLDEQGVRAMLSIDREGLAMAAGSYAKKRAGHSAKRARPWPWQG